MSDRELIFINKEQFERIDLLLNGFNGVANKLLDVFSPAAPLGKRSILAIIAQELHDLNQNFLITNTHLGSISDHTLEGFDRVAEAVSNLKPPEPPPAPKPKGIIMARFRVPADNPDFVIELVGSGFTDQEGNPAGARDIDLSVESSNPDAVAVSISGQTVSEDGNTVTAQVAVHVGAPAADVAAVAYKATNRDNGALAASGSDEFIVQAGEASVGTITSSVPLTPEA